MQQVGTWSSGRVGEIDSCFWSCCCEGVCLERSVWGYKCAICLWHPRLPKRWDAEMIWKLFNGGRHIQNTRQSLIFSHWLWEEYSFFSSLEMQKAPQLWGSTAPCCCLMSKRSDSSLSLPPFFLYYKLCCVMLGNAFCVQLKKKRQSPSLCFQRNSFFQIIYNLTHINISNILWKHQSGIRTWPMPSIGPPQHGPGGEAGPPTHPTDAWLDSELGNSEAKSTPPTHYSSN